MLMKDKDILADDNNKEDKKEKKQAPKIDKKNMSSAWGDAFDYYIRGITEKYLYFHGRATRLEFFGFMVASFIVFFVMYGLGVYIDMPMLAYYFAGATLIPTIAVLVRRFHDINKKAIVFLVILGICCLSGIFIGFWALILVAVWAVFIAKMLLKPSSLEESIFGPCLENDEIYEKDNELIIKKFFKLAVSLFIGILLFSGYNFDVWKAKNAQKQLYNDTLEKVATLGAENNLSKEEIKKAQDIVRDVFRKQSGQKASIDEINKFIETTVLSFKKK